MIPYARNPRKNDHVVDDIAAAIREFGFRVPILAKADGTIVDGHLRWKAAKKLGLSVVPVLLADDLTETQIKAFRLSVNKMADKPEWDYDLLKLELEDLQVDEFDLALTGFTEDELVELLTGSPDSEGLDDNYSRKIVAPIYEPKGDKPPVDSLFDDEKTRQLISAIDSAEDLPGDVAEFLRHAARRHTVFHFARIAEFYAHAPPHLQELMEDSALVIIDFQKAIENGFVHMTEQLGKIADFEEGCDEG